VEYVSANQRYRLHDLARDLCVCRCPARVRDNAAARHAAHFVAVLAAANRGFLRGGDGIPAALARFDREWPNIQAGQTWVSAHVESDGAAARLTVRYSDAGAYILSLRQYAREHL